MPPPLEGRRAWLAIARGLTKVVGFLVWSVVLSGIAFADHQAEQTNSSRGLRVKLLGLSPDDEVTGTNVNFTIALEAFAPSNPQAPHYAVVAFDELKIYIEDTLVYSVTRSPGVSVPTSKAVRFASTYFEHGTEVELKAVAKLGCYNFGTPPPFPPPLVLADTITTTLTMNVETRNRATVLATHEDLNKDDEYVFTASPGAPQYSYVAKQGAMAALDILGVNKHQVVPSAYGDLNQVVGEDVLLGYLQADNYLFAFTHGDSSMIRASFDDQGSGNGDEELTWSEIASAGRTTSTGRNLALLYACSALDGGSSMKAALGISGPNRAAAGFTVPVWSAWDDENGIEVLLNNHSTLVLTWLVAGKTIGEAVLHANETYSPRDADGELTEMAIEGDAYTRSHYVYAEDSTKLNAWRNQWYCLP